MGERTVVTIKEELRHANGPDRDVLRSMAGERAEVLGTVARPTSSDKSVLVLRLRVLGERFKGKNPTTLVSSLVIFPHGNENKHERGRA